MTTDNFTIELDINAKGVRATAEDVLALADVAERTARAAQALRNAFRGLDVASPQAAAMRELAEALQRSAQESAHAAREAQEVAESARNAAAESDRLRAELEREIAALRDAHRAATVAAESTADLAAALRDADGDAGALAGELGDTEDALDRVRRESDDAGDALRGLADDARRADNAADGAGASIGAIAAGAFAAAGGMEILKKGFEQLVKGFQFAIAAANEYQQGTEEGRRRQEFFTEQLTEARLEIGRVVSESNLYNDALVLIVENLPRAVDGVESLVESLDDAQRVFVYLEENTRSFREWAEWAGEWGETISRNNPLTGWAYTAGDAIGGLSEGYEYFASTLEHAEQVSEWAGESIRTDIDEMAASASAATVAVNDFALAFGNVSDAAATIRGISNPFGLFDPGRPAGVAAPAPGGGGAAEREIANAVETQKMKEAELANIRQLAIDAELAREQERAERLAAQEEYIAEKRIAAAERVAEAQRLLDEQRLADAEATAAAEAARLEATAAKYSATADTAKAAYETIAGGIGTTLAEGIAAGKDSEAQAGAIIGGGLVDLGKSAIAAAAVKAIADPAAGFVPNPAGAAALAGAGLSAIATGKLIGGSALTDSGGAPAAPREVPAPREQGPRTTNNFTIQTGIGDPRAIALQVADAVNNAQKMGLINGAR